MKLKVFVLENNTVKRTRHAETQKRCALIWAATRK